MPINRATFFFKDENGAGWTETIHSNKADLTATLTAAKALLPLRVACLGQTAFCIFIRVSDDLVKRDSKIYKVPAADGAPKDPGIGDPDYASTCLVVRIDANPITRRTLYMRGIPDAIVKQAGQYLPSPAFRAAFTAWRGQLISDGWCCRSKNPAAAAATITLISQDVVTGAVTITTLAPHGFAINQPIWITGVKGCSSLNNSWVVYNVPTPTTFIVRSNVLLPIWQGGGIAKPLTYILTPITDALVMQVGGRKAGRPLGQLRGRRSAHKLK